MQTFFLWEVTKDLWKLSQENRAPARADLAARVTQSVFEWTWQPHLGVEGNLSAACNEMHVSTRLVQ